MSVPISVASAPSTPALSPGRQGARRPSRRCPARRRPPAAGQGGPCGPAASCAHGPVCSAQPCSSLSLSLSLSSPPPQFPGWPRPASWLWLCAAGSPAFGTSAADSSCGHAAARGQPHRLAAASPTRPGLPRASPSRTSPIRGPAPRESASTALALHTGSPANCQPWPHEQGAAVSHGAHRYHLGPRPDPAAARVTVPLFKPRHPPLDQQKLRPPDSAPGGTVLASGGGGDRHTAPRAPWFRRRRCSLCQLEAGGPSARCQPGRFLLGP